MIANTDGMIHMHLHTDMSGFDGMGTAMEFAEAIAARGQHAFATTEHGTLRGIPAHAAACKKYGLKPIFGCEFYLADNASQRGLTPEDRDAIKVAFPTKEAAKAEIERQERARRDRDHVTVWALTQAGLRNLYRLSSWSWTKGFYFKPRIDIARLIEFQDGLAVSTGCPHGVVAWPLAQRRTTEAIDRTRQLAEVFGDRLYVEVMPHVIPGCDHVAGQLVKLAQRFGCKIVATQDAHYPCVEDAEAQEVLLCIHTRSKMGNPDRFCFSERTYWARGRSDMEEAFARSGVLPRDVYMRALDETLAFADRCEATFDGVAPGTHLVAPDLPPDVQSHDAWVMQICKQGSIQRFGRPMAQLGADYRQRLLHELSTIRDFKFAPYFIAVWDVRRWARDAGILCGPGRGSAAGSLVSYLMGITDLDPIEHGLMFERFISPGRGDLPDVDMDFTRQRRGEVIGYLRDQYGADRVAGIATHNTFGGKRVIRDVGRAFDVPDREIAAVASLIVPALDEESADDGSLRDVLEGTEIGKKFATQHPDAAMAAMRLEGQLRDVGMHAAGVVIAAQPISEIAPLESRARGSDRQAIVAWDMRAVEKAGLVKMDILGLNTLDIVDLACRLAGVDPHKIPMDDPDVYDEFTAGHFAGVFQFDTTAARRACRGVIFRQLADVATMTALDRPGPAKAGMPQIYAERCNDPTKIPMVHPAYDEVTAGTLGVIVYQEQVIKLVVQLAGYTIAQADAFRKKISKKLGVSDEHDRFVDGAVANGMPSQQAEKLFDELVGFGQYAFNASHSYCYASIGYWCMWLKVHHPAEFFCGYLANTPDKNDQARLAIEARRLGVRVSAPSVQLPSDRFTIVARDDGRAEIVGALSDISGIGSDLARQIAVLAPFTSIRDLYVRSKAAGCRITVRQVEAMARATALRGLIPNAKVATINASTIWSGAKSGWTADLDLAKIPDWTEDELALAAAEVYPLFATERGRSAFDADLARTAKATPRELLTPGDPEIDDRKAAVVFGKIGAIKRFPAENGKRSGRMSLLGPGGEELVLRVDHDVLEDCSAALRSVGTHVVGVVTGVVDGRGQIDRVWTSAEFVSRKDDRILNLIRKGPSTRPADPGHAIAQADEGDTVTVEGAIVRIRQHPDKNGGTMATLIVAGSAGVAKLLVFASKWADPTLQQIAPGELMRFRGKKLSGDAATVESWSQMQQLGKPSV